MTAIRERRVDVAVIGAGPAGVAAGCAARYAGADNVVIFERDREPGGILQQCIHHGFGFHTFGLELTGPEYMHKYIEKARMAGAVFELNTTVLRMERPIIADGRAQASFWTMSPERGAERVTAGAVVLAMGCRERPAGTVGLAGTRPSGVYTAGTAQRLVNMEGMTLGEKVVVMGTGDIGLIMARRMRMQGAEVAGVFEIMPWVSGLRRNVAQCLDDFGIPYSLGSSVCEIHGRDRLEGVTVADMGLDMTPLSGTERFVACDTLLLAVGLIPENELSRMTGIEIDPSTNGPLVNEFMQTGAGCVFAAGNVVTVYDLADFASREGERAGTYAARYADGGLKPSIREIAVTRGNNVRMVSPQRISGISDAELYLRAERPIEGRCRLSVNCGLFSRELRYVRPGEMIEARLTSDLLASLPMDVREVVVSVDEIL